MPRNTKTIASFQDLVDRNYGPGNYTVLKRERTETSDMITIRCESHNQEFESHHWKLRNKNYLDCRSCRAEHDASGKARKTYIEKAIGEIMKAWPSEGYTFEKTEESYMKSFLDSADRPEAIVTCPIHGDFKGSLYHIKHYGCMACTTEGKYGRHSMRFQNRDQLIAQLQLVHGKAYDLSRVEFFPQRYGNKIEIGCEHGWKKVPLATVLNGGGCFYCSTEKVKQQRAAGTFKKWWGVRRKPDKESKKFTDEFLNDKDDS